jgi:hypothetical protein
MLYFDRYLLHALVPHNIYFENQVDLPLFCGEDLNFSAFSKYFSLGEQIFSHIFTAIARVLLNKKCKHCTGSSKSFCK